MAIAKVILNDASQIDLTSDTVTAESLLNGYTAHDASGTQITGAASGSGGDPGDEFEWATTTNQVVTIGANSVTNTQSAKSFFDAYASYNMCILLSPLTDENQLVYCGTSGAMRYRNGALASVIIGSAYDAKLVEGTKYLLIGE